MKVCPTGFDATTVVPDWIVEPYRGFAELLSTIRVGAEPEYLIISPVLPLIEKKLDNSVAVPTDVKRIAGFV